MPARSSASAPAIVPADADLVVVWGEGADFGAIPAGAKIVCLDAWLAPENGHADVFLPLSIQTERAGHYTNFEGTISAFEACFERPAHALDAAAVFAALAGQTEAVA